MSISVDTACHRYWNDPIKEMKFLDYPYGPFNMDLKVMNFFAILKFTFGKLLLAA